MSNNSILPIDRTLSDAPTLGQGEPRSNDNKGVLNIPPKLQDWSLTIRLFNVISRTLVGGGGSNPSAEMQLVYSIVLTN